MIEFVRPFGPLTMLASLCLGISAQIAEARMKYGPAYSLGLETRITLLEQGTMATVDGWAKQEPGKNVCRGNETCASYAHPDGYPVIFLRDDNICFASWTSRAIVGPGEPVGAMFETLERFVKTGRLVRTEPRPFAINLHWGISEVYTYNNPPLHNLQSFIGCSADGAALLVNVFAAPDRLTRFETVRLTEGNPECQERVS